MLHHFAIKEKLLAAEVVLKEGADAVFRCITFTRQGGQISCDTAGARDLSREAFMKMVKKNQAVALLFSGKGVMTRKITHDIPENDEDIFSMVLPGSGSAEFCYSVYKGHASCWISLLRKNAAEPVINALHEAGVFVVYSGCGPQHICSIMNYLPEVRTELIAGNYHIDFSDGEPADIQTCDEVAGKVNFSGEQVDNRMLMAISAGFSYYNSAFAGSEKNHAEPLLQMTTEYRYYKKTRNLLVIALIVAFTLLFINYILFSKISGENAKLSTLVSAFSSQLQQADSLQAEAGRKQAFLEDAGLTGTFKISMMADRLASELPEMLSLESLDIFPVIRNENENQLSTEKGMVRIIGITPDAVELNAWIRCLSSYPWIHRVTIKNYSKMDDHSSSRFELEITVQQS